ncbi:TCR/Tet family MFS transporter [Rhodoblastus sp.]|jgi:DHA1 family tetracycline resistance protein-like MFS transporter|uniref:TCR/Tet family MFS transporter n=1 Tax=Rhodoblastus sp. TaxID=1962975 RepID=UPI0025E5D227|nr:TCR/Tet family MFS transporter [Rhodoblastus sp.]
MAMQNYKPGKAAFLFIFITVALDMIALGVMIPVLPKLIVSFEGGDFGTASRVVGYFGIAWAFMQFVFQPVLGSLSDRFGRRPVVLLSNIGLGLDYVVMALAPTLGWLFLGRLISGAASASFSTAGAYIADITPADKRAARFGMLGGAFGLGFVLGPAIGGYLGQIDLRLPFWAAAGFSLLNACYGFFVLPESLAPENRTKSIVWKTAHVLGSLRFLGREPALALLSAAIFLSYLAHDSLPSIFVLYTSYRYHWDARTTGEVLALVGLAQTIVAAGLVRQSVKKFGELPTAMFGLACGVAGFVAYALAPNGTVFIAALPLVALWGLAGPAFQALATRLAGVSEQGTVQGAIASLRGISGMIGPIAYTQILSWEIAGGRSPGGSYGLAALLLGLSLVFTLAVGRAKIAAGDAA